jgi:hypothetical protein
MISHSGGADNISLYPLEDSGLYPPIASFQLRILDTIGKRSQILVQSGDLIIINI